MGFLLAFIAYLSCAPIGNALAQRLLLKYKFAGVWFVFQVNEPSTTVGSPGETLSRRCVALLKTALRPDVWPGKQPLK